MPEHSWKYDYRMVIKPAPEDGGGGWIAEAPEVPGCAAFGETIEEAIEELEESVEAWINVATEDGRPIPEAAPSEYEYSGKFTLRIPRSLHRQLAMQAEAEGVSLNQHCTYLLANRAPSKEKDRLTSKLHTIVAKGLDHSLRTSLRFWYEESWGDSEITDEQGGAHGKLRLVR